MIAMLLLAGTAHCATASFCPTLDELRAAVRVKTDEDVYAIIRAMQAEKANDFVTVAPARILRISDVYCGAPFDDPPSTITCKMTEHYASNRSFRIVSLTREKEGWRITESLAVRQDR